METKLWQRREKALAVQQQILSREKHIVEKVMRAIGFRNDGSVDVLQELRVPRPALAADSVLIRIAAAGVNPADWRLRSARLRFVPRPKLPFVPGSDVAGIVQDVGTAVTQFRPGDAVYAMLPASGGGGYAEYVVAAETIVAHLPTNITFVEGAGVPLAALTALQALRDTAGLEPGMHVLINGASGGVGSFAVQVAKLFGARVTAVCSGRNVGRVQQLGADEVIDYAQSDITLGGPRYHVIFDAVNAHRFRRWRRLLRPGGQVVTVNPLAGKFRPQWFAYFQNGQRLNSLLVQPSGKDLQTLSSWIAAGHVQPAIDACYSLADAGAAHRYSETQRVRGKLVLVVNPTLAFKTVASLLEEQFEIEHQPSLLPFNVVVEDKASAVAVY